MSEDTQTATENKIDIKPRSRVVTDGIHAAPARGMFRAVGMGDDDFAKPQIGVASSWNEITPCNLSLNRLAQGAKEGVHAGGGFPMQFGTISVSDGISMGHEGMHFSLVSREVIADSVETVMQAERIDGSVLLAGCDKSLPGMLMAAARLDLASVFLYAGSIMPGWVKLEDGSEKEVTLIDAFEAVGACAAGKMSLEDLTRIEKAICPGEGACGGMYTANTMACIGEALGMSLPGSAAPPSADRRRDEFARKSGEAVVNLLRLGITARDIMTKKAFENAIAVTMAFGGSTNAVLHLLAIAREAEVELNLEDFNRIGDKIPHLGDLKPFGRYVMTDVDKIGGVPVIMRALLDAGLLHGDCLTVTGKTVAENLAAINPPDLDGKILRAMDNPIHKTGGITILHGTMAPEGAVVKSAGFDADIFEGTARVFEREQGALAALDEGLIKAGDVVVIRYEGPKGGPACARCSPSRAPSRAPGWARTYCSSPTAASPAEPPASASATLHRKLSTAAPSPSSWTGTGSAWISRPAASTCWLMRPSSNPARSAGSPSRPSSPRVSSPSTPSWSTAPPRAHTAGSTVTFLNLRPLVEPNWVAVTVVKGALNDS
ncbi:dihydroxy-acid dehydratase [Arthrobacter sp. Hiyo4]|nr:dihydroxy-acid dehydratase [Arthrobacter sp. Hiyo4]